MKINMYGLQPAQQHNSVLLVSCRSMHFCMEKPLRVIIYTFEVGFDPSIHQYITQTHISILHRHTSVYYTDTHQYITQTHISILHRHTSVYYTDTHQYITQTHISILHRHTSVYYTDTHQCITQTHISILHRHTSVYYTDTHQYITQIHIRSEIYREQGSYLLYLLLEIFTHRSSFFGRRESSLDVVGFRPCSRRLTYVSTHDQHNTWIRHTMLQT